MHTVKVTLLQLKRNQTHENFIFILVFNSSSRLEIISYLSIMEATTTSSQQVPATPPPQQPQVPQQQQQPQGSNNYQGRGGGRGRGGSGGRGGGRTSTSGRSIVNVNKGGRGRGGQQQQGGNVQKISANTGIPFGHVPAYLPGSSSLVEELDQRIMIVLRDGRHLVGVSVCENELVWDRNSCVCYKFRLLLCIVPSLRVPNCQGHAFENLGN